VPTEDDAHAAEAAVAVLVGRVAMLHRAGGGGLLECFAGVADPRSTRGIRHALSTILGLCTAAVLSGCVTLVEITDWVTHADQELLGALGARHDPTGRCVPPHPDTIERVFRALGAQGLADQLGRLPGPPGRARAGRRPAGRPCAAAGAGHRWQGGQGRDRGRRADPLPAGRGHPHRLRGDRGAADRRENQ